MDEMIRVVNKTPIEIALQIDDEGYTTAKRLYDWLYEGKGSHYASWVKSNVVENPFVNEDEYSPILRKPQKQGGRPTQDYKISANLAKKISMAEKTEKGEQARDYFIGCEQVLVRLAEQKRQTEIERAKGIAVRQALTKAIQQSNENERMHGHAYSTYTDIVYKVVFDRTAKQLREDLGIAKKENLRDFFSQEELEKVQSVEMIVSGLVNCGWGYNEIKSFVFNENRMLITA